MAKLDIDHLLVNYIGEFGKYQRLIFPLISLVGMMVTSQNLIHTFTGVHPGFICDENITVAYNIQDSSLHKETDDYPDLNNTQCSQKGVLFRDRSVSTECIASHFTHPKSSSKNYTDSSELQICCNYGFDKSVYKSTIITEWQLICNKEWLSAFSQSLHMVGCFIGSVWIGHLTDRYGRRKLILITSLGSTIVGVGCGVANNFWLYSVMRLLLGVFIAGQFNAAYVLALELVGPSYRQFAATAILLNSSLGVMVMSCVAYFIRSWRWLQIVISVPSLVLFFIYLWVLPESPRWFLSRNRDKEAKLILRKISKVNRGTLSETDLITHENTPSLDEVKQQENEDINVTKKAAHNVLDICKTPVIRYTALHVILLWFVTATNYYGLSLYSSALGGNDFLNLFLSGLVEMPAYLASTFMCKRFGYKKPLAVSMLLSGVVLVSNMFVSEIIAANITLSLVGKMGISVTFACIYPFAAELFPTVMRTLSIGTTSTGARFGAFVAPYINLLGKFERVAPLVVMGAAALAGAFIVWLLPERSGKPLLETISDAEAMSVPCKYCINSHSQEEKKQEKEESENCLKLKPENNEEIHAETEFTIICSRETDEIS